MTQAGGQTERPFRVGMIASPHPHAPMHLRTLQALPAVEAVRLCGVAGQDPAALAGDSAKVHAVAGDPTALFGDPQLDALVICVRNDLCAALLAQAVAAGKPAIFEKPGALSAADLRRVAESAAARGVPLGTFYQWRGHPLIQEVKRAVDGGALGRVMAVEARMVTSQVRYRDPSHWLFSRDQAGSGILSWLGCHYLDLLCHFLDDRVAEVVALVGRQNPEPIEVEDTACLALRFAGQSPVGHAGGVLGTLHAGYLLPGSTPGYSGAAYDTFIGLRGTDGYARLPLSDGLSYQLFSQAPGWAAGGRREQRFELPSSPAYGGKAGEQFVLDFLRGAREGRQPLSNIQGAVHVLEIVEAALESSASGRAVRIP